MLARRSTHACTCAHMHDVTFAPVRAHACVYRRTCAELLRKDAQPSICTPAPTDTWKKGADVRTPELARRLSMSSLGPQSAEPFHLSPGSGTAQPSEELTAHEHRSPPSTAEPPSTPELARALFTSDTENGSAALFFLSGLRLRQQFLLGLSVRPVLFAVYLCGHRTYY